MAIRKKLNPGNAPAEPVVLRMERVQVGGDDQITGPYHTRWPNDKSSTYPGKTETGDLGRQDEKDAESDSEWSVVPQLARYRHI